MTIKGLRTSETNWSFFVLQTTFDSRVRGARSEVVAKLILGIYWREDKKGEATAGGKTNKRRTKMKRQNSVEVRSLMQICFWFQLPTSLR